MDQVPADISHVSTAWLNSKLGENAQRPDAEQLEFVSLANCNGQSWP